MNKASDIKLYRMYDGDICIEFGKYLLTARHKQDNVYEIYNILLNFKLDAYISGNPHCRAHIRLCDIKNNDTWFYHNLWKTLDYNVHDTDEMHKIVYSRFWLIVNNSDGTFSFYCGDDCSVFVSTVMAMPYNTLHYKVVDTAVEMHIKTFCSRLREVLEYFNIEVSEPAGDRRGITKKKRVEVFKRDNYTCLCCGAHGGSIALEVDHIVPVAHGGNAAMDNLQTLCFDCNRRKGATYANYLHPEQVDEPLMIRPVIEKIAI